MTLLRAATMSAEVIEAQFNEGTPLVYYRSAYRPITL